MLTPIMRFLGVATAGGSTVTSAWLCVTSSGNILVAVGLGLLSALSLAAFVVFCCVPDSSDKHGDNNHDN